MNSNMNRIRKYNDKYQVLITPHHRFDSGFELMLGNWTDENLAGYRIITFDRLEDAMREAQKYPNIDWDQLVLWNKDNFNKIREILRYELNDFNVRLISILRNSKQVKDIMFNGVMALGDNFRLVYNMNVITFYVITHDHITTRQLPIVLSDDPSLNILYKTNDKKSITLVGKTDLSTTYEIKILQRDDGLQFRFSGIA